MVETTELIENVLTRHGYDPRPYRLLCPFPDHQDRRPGSVSIFVGRDGKQRLYCHACLHSEDSWGLQELFGERVRKPAPVRRPRRKQRLRQRRLEYVLSSRPHIEEEYALVTVLARQFKGLDESEQLSYVYDNQATLRDTGSPGFILQLADRLANG